MSRSLGTRRRHQIERNEIERDELESALARRVAYRPDDADVPSTVDTDEPQLLNASAAE
jgi:hypothetical protein